MPKISFSRQTHIPIEVDSGTNLMLGLLSALLPVASSCHGEAVCGKCIVTVTKGAENLSAVNDDEAFLKERLRLKSEVRVSCQAKVMGDIEIDASYW